MPTSRTAVRLAASSASILATLALVPASASAAGAVSYLSDTFGEASSTSAVETFNAAQYGDDASAPFPCLTAGTSTTQTPVAGCALGAGADPAGAGALRLTDTGLTEVSTLATTSAEPLAAGLDITFTEAQYAPAGSPVPGDGIALWLVSGTQDPVEPGGDRGSLGYSPSLDHGAGGLLGGWIGVGFDHSGLYSTSNAGGEDCTGGTSTATPDSIAIRGAGVGFNGYCLLAPAAPLPAAIGGFQGTTRANSMRTVQILVNPTAMTITAQVEVPGTTTFTTVATAPLPTTYYDSSGDAFPGLPARVYVGLTADTGDADGGNGNVGSGTDGDIHEIEDFSVSSMGLPTLPNPVATTPEAPLAVAVPAVGVLVGWGLVRRHRRGRGR